MRDFSKFPNLTHFSKIELSLVWSNHCNKTKSTLLELILKIRVSDETPYQTKYGKS